MLRGDPASDLAQIRGSSSPQARTRSLRPASCQGEQRQSPELSEFMPSSTFLNAVLPDKSDPTHFLSTHNFEGPPGPAQGQLCSPKLEWGRPSSASLAGKVRARLWPSCCDLLLTCWSPCALFLHQPNGKINPLLLGVQESGRVWKARHLSFSYPPESVKRAVGTVRTTWPARALFPECCPPALQAWVLLLPCSGDPGAAPGSTRCSVPL